MRRECGPEGLHCPQSASSGAAVSTGEGSALRPSGEKGEEEKRLHARIEGLLYVVKVYLTKSNTGEGKSNGSKTWK